MFLGRPAEADVTLQQLGIGVDHGQRRADAFEETVETIALPGVAVAHQSFTFIRFQLDRSSPTDGYTGNTTARITSG